MSIRIGFLGGKNGFTHTMLKKKSKLYLRKYLYRNNKDGICEYCGKEGADSLDHIIPQDLNILPYNPPENFCFAHKKCNEAKGNFYLGNGIHTLNHQQQIRITKVQQNLLDQFFLDGKFFDPRPLRPVVMLSYLKLKEKHSSVTERCLGSYICSLSANDWSYKYYA